MTEEQERQELEKWLAERQKKWAEKAHLWTNFTDIGPVELEVLSGARQDAPVFVRVSVGNDGIMEGDHDAGEYPSLGDAQQAPGVHLPVHWAREEIWERLGGTTRLVALCTPESGGTWVMPE